MQILEYFKAKHANETAALTNWLARLVPPDEALRDSAILPALAKLDRCKTFYTTNYDDFLERTLQLVGRAVDVIATEAQMGVRTSNTEVVKFHGDLNHPSQIVLTESDYERRLTLNSALDHKFRADLMGRTPLFLGYSFRDPNVSYLFRKIQDERQDISRAAPSAYIVVQDPSDFEFVLFRERHMEIIPVEGATLETQIAELLTQMME